MLKIQKKHLAYCKYIKHKKLYKINRRDLRLDNMMCKYVEIIIWIMLQYAMIAYETTIQVMMHRKKLIVKIADYVP